MTITNQHFTIDNPSFPQTPQSVDDYKDYFTQTFLEGFRFQLIDWKDNINNETNTEVNSDANFPTIQSLTDEISKIETALTEKYGWTND